MTDRHERWAGLYNEAGELDGFLLAPLGHLGTSLRIAAVRGGYAGELDPVDLVLVIRRGAEIGFATLPPKIEVHGLQIGQAERDLLAAFMVRHRVALLAHWTGEIDSMDLWDQVL
jgi:hypothetical protein